jgi:nucleoside-diphosphate-sugar epimerase
MPTVTDNLLKACEETGSALVFPGNVYVYGRFQKIPATENHPIAATNKKGKLRIELERKLMEAQKSSRAQVVIPRFPDYFGPNVTNRLIKPIFDAVVQGKKASWLGKLDVEHNMVYIDDAAAACVTLGAKEASYGQVWHVPGAGPITGRRFIEMAFEAAGTKQNIGVTSSRMMKFFGLFSSDAREMNELLYEFDEPLVLDGNKFAKAFPSFRYTPYEEAMQKTVEWFRDNSIQPK